MRRDKAWFCLTCSHSLYEESCLCSHRTLFEELHHASMSSCRHWLLVHLQDQVSLNQPGGCLRARLQHLRHKNTRTVTPLDLSVASSILLHQRLIRGVKAPNVCLRPAPTAVLLWDASNAASKFPPLQMYKH